MAMRSPAAFLRLQVGDANAAAQSIVRLQPVIAANVFVSHAVTVVATSGLTRAVGQRRVLAHLTGDGRHQQSG